jgi:hypothetical protein
VHRLKQAAAGTVDKEMKHWEPFEPDNFLLLNEAGIVQLKGDVA